MTLLFFKLSKVLPERMHETTTLRYGQLIWSMKELLLKTPTLQRRSFYQACMFGAFCLFWTIAPMYLLSSVFQFTQKGVALFALAGLAGAIAAPYAGKMADKGHGKKATAIAFAVGIISFLASHYIKSGSVFSIIVLIITANLLDAGVSAHLVLGQRAIFLIDPKNQSRLNGLYLALVYIGGSIGSALGGWAFLHGGWTFATLIGLCFPLIAMIFFLTEKLVNYVE